MSYKNFLRDLKKLNQNTANSYVICGENAYLRDLYLQIIKQKYSGVLIEKLDAKELSEKDLISNFQVDDLFSDQKILIIENFDSIRGEKKHLQNYLEQPDENLKLIFYTREEKETNFRKFLAKTKDIIYLDCSLFKIYNDDIEAFVDRLCLVQGFKIEEAAKQYLKRKCGPDLYLLANELKKLFVLKNSEKSINLFDTEKTVSKFEPSSVFEVVNAIASQDLVRAMKEISNLFITDSNAAMMISYNLYYLLERLILIKDMLKKEKAEIEIAKEVGLPIFVIKKDYLPLVKTLSNAKILQILKKLSDLDSKLRQSALSHRNLIDNFIISICKK